jgi:hypothetical protein
MDVYLDCLPCSLRQALEASRMATDDAKLHGKIMSDSAALLRGYKKFTNAPEICREVHRIVKEYTGNRDPYRDIKKKDIDTALALMPALKRFMDGNGDRLYRALKAAAMGNMLDSSIVSSFDFETCFEAELQKPFSICDIELFKQKLKTAKSLLVIADNAGETVFDCIMLNEFPELEITYAVRSVPILNDATEDDARASGIEAYAHIIPSGSDVPGTILSECTEEFLGIFNTADIVISKGQGNYETLSDCGRDIFFLLKAKCAVVSKLLGVDLNGYVFLYKT